MTKDLSFNEENVKFLENLSSKKIFQVNFEVNELNLILVHSF